LNQSPKPSLESEIDQLRAAVEDLSSRVAQLEGRFNEPRGTSVTSSVLQPTAISSKPDSNLGPKLINRIGALTLAIGIVFFFKYAVDNKWIGALGRVILGLIAGIVLVGLADWLRKRNQKVFSQGVAGCGLATIFISIYAAFAYYHLASPVTGFVALVLTCAFAVVLSLIYGSVSIGILGFVGAVFTALLLRNSAQPPITLHFPYLLLVSATAIVISLRQSWTVLSSAIGVLVLFAGLLLINEHHPYAFVVFCFVLAALHLGAAAKAGDKPRLWNALYFVGHAGLLLALIRLVALWAVHHSTAADHASITSELESFLLAGYGVAIAILGILRNSSADRMLAFVLLALVVAKLYLWDVWQLTRFYLVTAFIALGVILLVASFLYSRFRLSANAKAK
jgi:uncharacterized membrane protein